MYKTMLTRNNRKKYCLHEYLIVKISLLFGCFDMRSLYHFLYHLEFSWVKQETFIILVILVLFDEKFILNKHHFFPLLL